MCTYVRTNIHSCLFLCVWCVVIFSQASVVSRFLVVHITTFTRLFSCVVCRSNFNSIPDFRVPNCLCHCLTHLFYCVVCRNIFISVPDLGFLNVYVTVLHIYFIVWCAVTLLLASLILGFLIVCVNTLVNLFCLLCGVL